MSDNQQQGDVVAAPAPNDGLRDALPTNQSNAPQSGEQPVKPPRARVSDAIDDDQAQAPRQRDYLEGFLAASPETPAASGAGGELQQAVVDALKEIYDPEIPVNIYDLGLIYGVDVDDECDVTILMTLTTPHCPVAETMPGEVELRASSVPGIRDAEVQLVWDPPWSPEKMSDEARLELGML